MIDGEICDRVCCADALEGIDFVLHQAALGSGPAFDRRSHDPCPPLVFDVFRCLQGPGREQGRQSDGQTASQGRYNGGHQQ